MPSLAVSAGVFVVSLAALLASAEAFTRTAERIGIALGVSPFVVGATVVVAVVSLVAVVGSANYLVESILDIAVGVGVGSEVVAITAVSVGTSLPEIGVSVAAVRQGNADIAIGNVLGSNVFNTFAVMGVPSLLAPVTVPSSVNRYALPAMLLATALYFFIAQDREITRYDGFALLLLYATFLVNLFAFV